MSGDFATLLRDLGGLYWARKLYPSGSSLTRRAAEKVAASLERLGHPVRLARLGADLVVEDETVGDPPAALRGLFADLSARGHEALHLEGGIGPGEWEEWIERLVAGGDLPRGGKIRVGGFRLEGAADPALAELAADYLALMPGVEDSLRSLAAEQAEGLARAQEMVQAIAGRLAAGEELFRPIRELKTHDQYTFTHALNVCVLSAAMAQALGLPRDRANGVALAALCHDLGKERLPPEVLNKPARLTPEELAVLRRHPEEGARLLLGLGEVDPLLPVVAYQHHRGIGGQGYPDDPAAGPVHPVSLLVSVADVYDALRTVRPYRSARSAEVACTVLLEDVRRGHLHREYVSTLVGILGLLQPGRRVRLGDGRSGEVEEEGARDRLRPVVRTEDGSTVDLSREPTAWLAAVEEPPDPA